MKAHALLAVALPLAAQSLAAQSQVLYYKFDGVDAKALNYAAPSIAPGQGTVLNSLTTAPTTSTVPGRFGEALTSGITPAPYQANVVDTGWAPNVTGDYTWAMWMNNSRGTAGPSLTYVAGIPVSGAFRIYSGSSILLTVGNAGGGTYYSTVANVYQLATAGWVHVAFVVDTTAMTATYYINGVPEAPRALTGLPNIQGSTFLIGRQLPTAAPSIYDLDEFRFETRAVSATEIAAWATQNGAGSSAFGQGCDAAMAPRNGAPQIGNFFYELAVTSSAPFGVGVVAFGLSRTSVGPIPLPIDLGAYLPGMAGCGFECSPDASVLVVLDGAGSGAQPFPILPDQGLVGIQLYAQGLFVGGPRGNATTNPFAIAVGN